VLLAWLTTFPYCGPLPQSSHFIAISIPALQKIEKQSLNCSRSVKNRQTNAQHGYSSFFIGFEGDEASAKVAWEAFDQVRLLY
jgi:hypothetical protein